MYGMFSGVFTIFKSIMDTYFKETQSDSEIFSIDPPQKLIMKKLLFMWIGIWLSFMLTFNGKEVIMFFFWIPLGTGLIYFVHTWKKYGYSPMMYLLLNIVVLSTGYGLSRIVHFVIGVVING